MLSDVCIERHISIDRKIQRIDNIILEQETKIDNVNRSVIIVCERFDILINILNWIVRLLATGIVSGIAYLLQQYFIK